MKLQNSYFIFNNNLINFRPLKYNFLLLCSTPGHSPSTSRRSSRVSRSGSVPNLHESNGILQSPNRNCFLSKGAIAFRQQQHVQHHQHHNYHQSSHSSAHRNNSSSTGHHRRSGRSRHSSLTKRSTRETASYHNVSKNEEYISITREEIRLPGADTEDNY